MVAGWVSISSDRPRYEKKKERNNNKKQQKIVFLFLFLKGEREAVLVVGLFWKVGGWERVVDEGDFWKMPNNTSFFISDQWPVWSPAGGRRWGEWRGMSDRRPVGFLLREELL
jgi:hypothetical protein